MITLFSRDPQQQQQHDISEPESKFPSTRFSLSRRLSFRRPHSLQPVAGEEKEDDLQSPRKTASSPGFFLSRKASSSSVLAKKLSSTAMVAAVGDEEAPKPLSRRSSIASMFSTGPPRREPTPPSPACQDCYTDNMQRLARAIREKRRALVSALITAPGDLTVKIRFIDAVDQYMLERDETRQVKMGKTICSLFAASGGGSGGDMFRIDTFSPNTLQALEHDRFESFPMARMEMLRELAADCAVLAALSRID